MAGDLEAALAGVVATAESRPLPDAVLEATKVFVLDSLAVGVAGSWRPDAGATQSAIRGWGGGAEAATFLDREPVPAPTAACLNAFLIHGLEYDCVHEGAVVHAMAAPLAATLALAGRSAGLGRPVGGARLIRALAVGVDLAVALGLAARGPMRFFRPATASAFGATAAAASLLQLDPKAAASALGLTLGQVPGTLQAHLEGSALLPLQMGFAARAALQSVDLAASGLVGPRHWLDGPYGYLQLYENGEVDRAPLEAFAGGERSGRMIELSHKPYPSGRLTHAAVDGLGRLQAEHAISADAVERVRVVVPPLVERLVGRPLQAGMDATYARLCLAYCAACRLIRGRLGLPEFEPEVLHDPAVLRLGQRLTIEVDRAPGPTAIVPQTVEVRLADGRTFGVTLEHVRGSPEAPLDRPAQVDKVCGCFDHARPRRSRDRARRLIEEVRGLERLADVTVLLDRSAPGGAHPRTDR